MEALQQAILSAASTILVALIGIVTRQVVAYLNSKGMTEQLKAKREIVEIGVHAAEQLFKELNGPEKLEKAKDFILDELNEQGLNISDKQMDLFIESAVEEMQRSRQKHETELKIDGPALADGFEQLKLDID